MSALARKRVAATALAAAALASAVGASAVSARPVEQFMPGAGGDTAASQSEAPPPSSIAASVGEAYEDLRAAGAGEETQRYEPTRDSQPVVDEPTRATGFDLSSAAIGAAGTGLLVILLAGVGASGRLRRARPVTVSSEGTAS
jgi:hypothetical protein